MSLENQSQLCKEAGDLTAPDGINQMYFHLSRMLFTQCEPVQSGEWYI